jgi:hypothetical protein
MVAAARTEYPHGGARPRREPHEENVMNLSHAHGPTGLPLIDATIGEHIARTVERYPDREALVVRHQGYRASYRELWAQAGPTSCATRSTRPACDCW